MTFPALFGAPTKRATPEWDEERRASEPTYLVGAGIIEAPEGFYIVGPDGWDEAFVPRVCTCSYHVPGVCTFCQSRSL